MSDVFNDDFLLDDDNEERDFTEIRTLPCMSSHMDGAHWGLSDWYPEIVQGIQEALNLGPNAEWTTGWYGSKKEIASGRITSRGGKVICEAGVSDDFDTEGRGEVTIDHTAEISRVVSAMDEALDQAASNKRDNEVFAGFRILHDEPWIDYNTHPPTKHPERLVSQWTETYIAPVGDGSYLDSPPGDNYGEWGWQQDCDHMPKTVKDALEDWISRWLIEETGGEEEFTYEGWTVRPWDND